MLGRGERGGDRHGVPGLAEDRGEEAREIGIVLDQEETPGRAVAGGQP